MRRAGFRPRWKAGGSAFVSSAVAFAAALFLPACETQVTAGPGEFPPTGFQLTVMVTNVGNGFGRVDVTFPGGTVDNPCSEPLGPGESCSPRVSRDVRTETVDITAVPEPGSQFMGWIGTDCSSRDCTFQNQLDEFETTLEVDVRFDLVGTGEVRPDT